MTGHNPNAAAVAVRFGLHKIGRSWGGDCPACGYRDAFKVLVGKGARPGLWCANGCPPAALHAAASNALGSAWTPPPRPDDASERERQKTRKAIALELWRRGGSCVGTAAALYLASRGIRHAARSDALRFLADCGHPEGKRLPAMVALVRDAAGQPVACHRTYLTRDGRKASADPVRAGLGPVWGGAVRLDPAAPEMVIGEGIETSASAGLLLGLPAWAALSAGNLARGLMLPPEVRAVVIAADHDAQGTGQDAAEAAAARWRGDGRHVRIALPDRPGTDFNDVLLRKPVHAVAGVSHG